MSAKPLILVVDDAPNNLMLLVDLLTVNGYQVATAASGTEALAKVETDRPDLVLLDVVMPQMSGYEVCRRIRQKPATTVLPVVMITALDPAEERVKGLEAGADDFLSKPINQAELLARVKSLLRIKTLYNLVQDQATQLAELNANLEKRIEEQVAQLGRLAHLKRFFPPQLAELIIAGNVEDPLKTRRREVTVVFLDLRGFTAFADSAEPEEVMGLLRDYHGKMGDVIDKHGGALEQFAGDSLMVIFNDPVVIDDPAARAVEMAVEMQQRFQDLMRGWKRRGHEIALGIGVAHGYATIGAIGYEARIGYGVIGRVSNLAARLCGEATPGQILVNQSVFALVDHMVEVEEIGNVSLKGFSRPVMAYRVVKLK